MCCLVIIHSKSQWNEGFCVCWSTIDLFLQRIWPSYAFSHHLSYKWWCFLRNRRQMALVPLPLHVRITMKFLIWFCDYWTNWRHCDSWQWRAVHQSFASFTNSGPTIYILYIIVSVSVLSLLYIANLGKAWQWKDISSVIHHELAVICLWVSHTGWYDGLQEVFLATVTANQPQRPLPQITALSLYWDAGSHMRRKILWCKYGGVRVILHKLPSKVNANMHDRIAQFLATANQKLYAILVWLSWTNHKCGWLVVFAK